MRGYANAAPAPSTRNAGRVSPATNPARLPRGVLRTMLRLSAQHTPTGRRIFRTPAQIVPDPI